VIEVSKSQILQKLQFHQDGVQAIQFAPNNRFVVSIGNFKECTLCVWSWPLGQLLASSYSLDKLNDVKVSSRSINEEHLVEFVTVGRDQVQFWGLTKAAKLEYVDIFMPKYDNGQLPEIVAVEYFYLKNEQYVIAGTRRGEVLIANFIQFRLIHTIPLAAGEITAMASSALGSRILISTFDESLYYWDYLNYEICNRPSFFKIKVPFLPISLAVDSKINEGICGSQKGGVFYFNLDGNLKIPMFGSIDCKVEYKAFILSPKLFATSQKNGKFRLWNCDTAEEVMGYYWKSQVTALHFDKIRQKLYCLFENNNDYKVIDLQNFSAIDSFSELTVAALNVPVADNYPIKLFDIFFGGVQSRICVMKQGEICLINEPVDSASCFIHFDKIFEFPSVSDILICLELQMIIISDTKA